MIVLGNPSFHPNIAVIYQTSGASDGCSRCGDSLFVSSETAVLNRPIDSVQQFDVDGAIPASLKGLLVDLDVTLGSKRSDLVSLVSSVVYQLF